MLIFIFITINKIEFDKQEKKKWNDDEKIFKNLIFRGLGIKKWPKKKVFSMD